MIFRALTAIGLSTLGAVFACSDAEPVREPGAAGGGAGGSAAGQGGSQAQGGSAGAAGKGGGGSAATGGSGGGTEATGGTGQGGTAGGPVGGMGGDPGEPPGGAPNGGEAGSGPGGGDVLPECLDAPLLSDTRTEALSFTGAGLTLGIVRRADPDSFGTSGTTPWLPQRFALVRGNVAECVTNVAELEYSVSHHNFDDVFRASYGDETWVFRQKRQDYGYPATFSVESRGGGDALLWGPVSLTLSSCQELLNDESCAPTYLQ